MKVCYVSHDSKLAGTSQSLLDMLNAVKNEGVEPIVLLREHGPLEGKLDEIGIPHECIAWMKDVKTSGLKGLIKWTIHYFDFIQTARIIRFYKKNNIDLVHNNCMLYLSGARAAKKCKIPYVCHFREMIKEDHNMQLMSEKKCFSLIQKSACNIYISEFVKNKFYPISEYNKYQVIYNAVDNKRYYGEHNYDFNQRKKINLIIAGRVVPGKGQMDAVKAMKFLSKNKEYDFSLAVVGNTGGNTDYAEELYSYVEKNSLNNVKFIDFTDLKELRKKSDISLICSTNEAMGRVTVESMLSGTITIGANAGATKELIKDGVTGFLYETGNAEDLSEKILQVVRLSSNELMTIQENAHKFAVDNFNIENYGKKIIKIYEDILK